MCNTLTAEHVVSIEDLVFTAKERENIDTFPWLGKQAAGFGWISAAYFPLIELC